MQINPYQCKFCGADSWIDPSDQTPPADYCHESDHTNNDESTQSRRENDVTKQQIPQDTNEASIKAATTNDGEVCRNCHGTGVVKYTELDDFSFRQWAPWKVKPCPNGCKKTV